jgi:hypothetical protein
MGMNLIRRVGMLAGMIFTKITKNIFFEKCYRETVQKRYSGFQKDIEKLFKKDIVIFHKIQNYKKLIFKKLS